MAPAVGCRSVVGLAMRASSAMPSDAEELSKPSFFVSKETHYDVLQLSPTATSEEIKVAYRSLVVGCHPDKLPSILRNDNIHHRVNEDTQISEGILSIDIDDENKINNESVQCEADKCQSGRNESTHPTVPNTEEQEISTQRMTIFHQIQAAYHCLRDPDKRRQYDESISRKEDREGWKLRGALQVNLSEMDCDWCCVVDGEHSDDEEDGEGQSLGDGATDADKPPLQKVFLHPCRCGDTFQVIQEELVESLVGANMDYPEESGVFTDRVWQCESCSLTISIHVDMDVD